MPSRPSQVDDSPLSAFVAKMRDVFRRRLAAVELTDKAAIEREMKALMHEYLGRDAWEAAASAAAAAAADPGGAGVPRATRRRRARVGLPTRYAGDGFDRQKLAAGDREEE